jgi:hypothetical protein
MRQTMRQDSAGGHHAENLKPALSLPGLRAAKELLLPMGRRGDLLLLR